MVNLRIKGVNMSDVKQIIDHKVTINNIDIIYGDHASIKIIFSNLSGQDFIGKPKEYFTEYLSYMREHFKQDIVIGMPICHIDSTGYKVNQSKVGSNYNG